MTQLLPNKWLILRQTVTEKAGKAMLPLILSYLMLIFLVTDLQSFSPDLYLQNSSIIVNNSGTEWQYTGASQTISITKASMWDGDVIINPGTISFTKPVTSNALFMAQVIGKYQNGSPVPPSFVNVTTDATSPITITQPIINNQYGYSFIARLQNPIPVSHISTSVNGSSEAVKTARGVVSYHLDERPELWCGIGRITNRYVYGGSPQTQMVTETVLLPDLPNNPFDLKVSVVIADFNNDGRDFYLTAKAGSQSQTKTSANLIYPDVNVQVVDFHLTQVETNTLHIILESPALNGDSLLLAGYNASYLCNDELPSTPPSSPITSTVFLPIVTKPLILNISMVSTPTVGLVGLPMTFAIVVENSTDQIADAVEMNYYLPPNIRDIQTSCHLMPNDVMCSIGKLDPGDVFTTTVGFIPTSGSRLINRVYAFSTIPGANIGKSIVYETDVAQCLSKHNIDDDDFPKAAGPLLLNFTYCGTLDDSDDFYKVFIPHNGHMTATVSINVPPYASLPTVLLYSYSEMTKSSLEDYTYRKKLKPMVDHDVVGGQYYYIRVRKIKNFSNMTYTLNIELSPP